MTNATDKIHAGERLTAAEALELAVNADVLTLAQLANTRSKKLNGNRVAYLIDRNINYTNVCKSICRFCAFYRPKGHKESWEITFAELDQKIQETLEQGGTRILLQGGTHPDFKIDYYEKLVDHIHQNHKIHIHALSPTEIQYIAEVSGISIKEVIERLMAKGLASIPGGGAEILVDKIRDRISIDKCTAQQWLDVMQTAHELGLKTTATMMMGHAERWPDRIEHLVKLRDLQDKTQGFISFIPWTFQHEHTALNPMLKKNSDIILATTYDYLRLIAIARLFLDNFTHIQASNLTQGTKIAQVALHYGADDIGSIMLEENVVSSAGCDGAKKNKLDETIRAITDSGHIPYLRDSFYREIQDSRTARPLTH